VVEEHVGDVMVSDGERFIELFLDEFGLVMAGLLGLLRFKEETAGDKDVLSGGRPAAGVGGNGECLFGDGDILPGLLNSRDPDGVIFCGSGVIDWFRDN